MIADLQWTSCEVHNKGVGHLEPVCNQTSRQGYAVFAGGGQRMGEEGALISDFGAVSRLTFSLT